MNPHLKRFSSLCFREASSKKALDQLVGMDHFYRQACTAKPKPTPF